MINFQSIFDFLNSHTPLLYLNQSLWRDEAFSVLMSEPPVAKIIQLAAQDFNPPLYYLILHFWMKIFGNGEIAIRMLSFVFHLLLVYVCYLFAKKIFKSSIFYLLSSIFVFFNPMLIYYAFEARMYSLLALLATASMYFFFSQKWTFYVLASALGLWTQPFMIFVLLSQGAYLIFTRALKKIHVVSFVFIFLLFLPWIPVILRQLARSGPMWIWPINWTTITTILGNLFTGYEGTPGGLWNTMTVLSLIIMFFSFLVFRSSLSNFSRLLLIWLFLPVVVVLAVSYFKPIYVNRYLIFVTVAEVFITVIGISLVKNKLTRFILYTLYFILIVFFNLWFPSGHKKLDLRLTLLEVNKLAGPIDFIFAQTPLTFFEATYYTPNRSRVFLYNPSQTAVPFYAGANLITKDKMVYILPKYPIRAFLIYDDGSFEVISQE